MSLVQAIERTVHEIQNFHKHLYMKTPFFVLFNDLLIFDSNILKIVCIFKLTNFFKEATCTSI
jgi:hypothetical protein